MSVLLIPRKIFEDPALQEAALEKLYLMPVNIRYVNAQIKYLCGMNFDASELMQDEVFKADSRFHDKRKKFVVLSDLNESMIFHAAEIAKQEDRHYERGDWQYTDWSFRGNAWHPEDLFLESEGNREHGHWKPVSVEFDPQRPGIGNPYSKTGYNIPYWRLNPRHYAPLEQNCEDRRVQIPRRIGY